ncbi:MAG: ABC transporter permease [Anaerolineae bacterium]
MSSPVRLLMGSFHGAIGSALVLVMLVLVLFGAQIAPHSPTEFHVEHRLEPPGPQFLLGTDQFGRDVFSRVVSGARESILFGVASTILGSLLGLAVGVFSGYVGGRTDDLIMRILDALIAIPTLLLAMLVVTVLGPGQFNAVFAVAISTWPGMSRVARSATLDARTQDYVAAAQARGESQLYIMFSEVLPNTIAPIIVEASIRVAFAIMLGASLSFLGLGAQPPSADWGLMASQSRNYLFKAPWMIVGPSLGIALSALGFNLFGDGLRDALNPRL